MTLSLSVCRGVSFFVCLFFLDGLWDVLLPKEGVQLVRHYVSLGSLSLAEVAMKVVDVAIARGTVDNTTLMIIRVN